LLVILSTKNLLIIVILHVLFLAENQQKNGRIFYEVGFNSGRSLYNNKYLKTHAEISALHKYTEKLKIKKVKNKKVDLVVLRVDSNNIFKDSRPCYHCMESLKKSNININKLYFSVSNGTIECVNFKEWSKLQHNLSSAHSFRKNG
jgi:hypothetical protein